MSKSDARQQRLKRSSLGCVLTTSLIYNQITALERKFSASENCVSLNFLFRSEGIHQCENEYYRRWLRRFRAVVLTLQSPLYLLRYLGDLYTIQSVLKFPTFSCGYMYEIMEREEVL